MVDKKNNSTTDVLEIKELAYLTTINQLSDENNRLRNRVNYLELIVEQLLSDKADKEEKDNATISSNG